MSMWYPQLVHALMNCLPRFEKWTFKIFTVVILAVMVCGSALFVQWSCLTDVCETAVNEREHVVRCVFVEHPPLTSAADVYR